MDNKCEHLKQGSYEVPLYGGLRFSNEKLKRPVLIFLQSIFLKPSAFHGVKIGKLVQYFNVFVSRF